MRLYPVFMAVGLLAITSHSTAFAQRAVYIVRHAERLNNDPNSPLAPEGIRRAKALAYALKDAGVTAIYTSTFSRTKQTAEPLFQLLTSQNIAVSREARDESPANLVD